MIIPILIIAFLSTGQILRYYFSYEDFSLLYGVQFPNDPHSIFLYPGFVAYLFLRPLVTAQYFIFGYNPFWYYLVSLLLFLVCVALFYIFVRILYPQKKEIAFFAASIMASGYLGVETLTWNVFGGQIHLAFLIFCFLVFIFTLLFLKTYRKIHLIFLTIFLSFALYFFQFRSYLLFIWLPLLFLFKRIEEKKKISIKLLGGSLFLLAFLFLPFIESIQLVLGRIQRVNLDAGLYLTYLNNLGNILFPSDALESMQSVSLILGVFSLGLFILFPLVLILKRHKLLTLSLFFSLSVVLSLVVIMVVIAFIGQIPTIWPTSHRFYVVLLPFVSGFLAVFLSALHRKPQLFFFILIMITHIFFSNKVISERWENLSQHLRYFYTTIKTNVPEIDKPTVLLTTLTRPYPPGPFVSGSDAGSAHFLAGFYGKKFDEFLLATEPLQAIKMLIDNGSSANDIHAFDYKRDDIVKETDEIRDILLRGRRSHLGNNLRGQEIELTDLQISSVAPVFIRAKIAVGLSQVKYKPPAISGIMTVSQYLDLFFDQEEKRRKMTINSELSSLGDEHNINNIIDGEYETTWIPQEWGKVVEFVIDLGQTRNIQKIVWSSSRTAPWDFRQPSDYVLEISNDGRIFSSVDKVENAQKLKTGEFFTTDMGGRDMRYAKFRINKTRGGWTPAVDEIEFFDKTLTNEELINYFNIKKSPAEHFPNKEIAALYYNKILKGLVPVEINWKTDGDGGYLAGQEKVIFVEGVGITKEYLVLLPKTGRQIKSLRIRTIDFPSELLIENLEVWHPSLEEFIENKELLDVEMTSIN